LNAYAGNSQLVQLLAGHPRVDRAIHEPGLSGLRFDGAEGPRLIEIGNAASPFYGLVELMDNNPLLCTDRMSIPSLAGSLALICLGPLLLSGLVQEPPSFITSLEVQESELYEGAAGVGWTEGLTIQTEPVESEGAAFATGMAVIESIEHPEELADLYEERFAKSPLIRMHSDPDWSVPMVAAQPKSIYRIVVSVDEPTSLVSVRAMCDSTGRFQACQLIYAMNVMCGFEDDLGLGL
jgi:hypothetical protein